ncbi:unnamed protein product [Peronospora destructor]|uniref:Uncharacterized protein n=1 Tax=Peronospora destructor TaxID=86335 RepID=A0AAV0T6V6_9STRA|nr:unnamed protein product [Peronospora destructor]
MARLIVSSLLKLGCGLAHIARAINERGRVLAVAVSAMGHTVDHLLKAAALAAKGDADNALEAASRLQALTLRAPMTHKKS